MTQKKTRLNSRTTSQARSMPSANPNVEYFDLTKLDPKREVFIDDLAILSIFDYNEQEVVPGSDRLVLCDYENDYVLIFDDARSGRKAKMHNGYVGADDTAFFRFSNVKGNVSMSFPNPDVVIGELRDLDSFDYEKAEIANREANGKYSHATALIKRIAECAEPDSYASSDSNDFGDGEDAEQDGALEEVYEVDGYQIVFTNGEENINKSDNESGDSDLYITLGDVMLVAERIRELGSKLSKFDVVKNGYKDIFRYNEH